MHTLYVLLYVRGLPSPTEPKSGKHVAFIGSPGHVICPVLGPYFWTRGILHASLTKLFFAHCIYGIKVNI